MKQYQILHFRLLILCSAVNRIYDAQKPHTHRHSLVNPCISFTMVATIGQKETEKKKTPLSSQFCKVVYVFTCLVSPSGFFAGKQNADCNLSGANQRHNLLNLFIKSTSTKYVRIHSAVFYGRSSGFYRQRAGSVGGRKAGLHCCCSGNTRVPELTNVQRVRSLNCYAWARVPHR